jgi:hypothetical protein
MRNITNPRQVQAAFNRMIETLEANLAPRQVAETQKAEPAAKTGAEQPVRAYDGSAGEIPV